MLSQRDYREVGRLIQWGLRADAFPGNEPEYAEGLSRFLDDGEFRDALVHLALGLGLEVIDGSENGLVLAPSVDSMFRVKTATYRSSTGADDRLLEGFIHVGIAATVFPRSEFIEEGLKRRRPPITVEEVEELLRQISDALAEEAEGQPDPTADELEGGFYEAWRVYRHRVTEDSGRRRVGVATKTLITKTLETLTAAGMFVRRASDGLTTYQPTHRYQTQVVEFSANTAFRLVRDCLGDAREGAAYDA